MYSGRTGAIDNWRSRVEAHHAQSERVMDESILSGDFWRRLAPMFRADPRRTDDEALNAIAELVDEGSTLLDVGGGAGRFAVALAFRCRSVAVVDPSESMLEQLSEAVAEAGLDNVTGIGSAWESAAPEPADFVLCSHVVYGVADVEPFVRKLAAHSSKRVALLSFVDSPQSGISSLWKPVHEEERIDLPALPELVNVLWEMDIYPSIQMLTPSSPSVFDDVESALAETKQRLFVSANSAAERRLEECIEDYLEQTADGRLRIHGARPTRQGLISWEV